MNIVNDMFSKHKEALIEIMLLDCHQTNVGEVGLRKRHAVGRTYVCMSFM